jgi:hypothetical protein
MSTVPACRCLVFLFAILPAMAQPDPEWKPYTIEHRQSGAEYEIEVKR